MNISIRISIFLAAMFACSSAIGAEIGNVMAGGPDDQLLKTVDYSSNSRAVVSNPNGLKQRNGIEIDMIGCDLIYNGEFVGQSVSGSIIPPNCYRKYKIGKGLMQTGLIGFSVDLGCFVGYCGADIITRTPINQKLIWTFSGLAVASSAIYFIGVMQLKSVARTINSRSYLDFGIRRDGTIGLAIYF